MHISKQDFLDIQHALIKKQRESVKERDRSRTRPREKKFNFHTERTKKCPAERKRKTATKNNWKDTGRKQAVKEIIYNIYVLQFIIRTILNIVVYYG